MNLKRRDFIKKFSCACCAPLFLPSCTEVAITNRKQLSIISDENINQQALQAYEKVKKQENFFMLDLNRKMLKIGKNKCINKCVNRTNEKSCTNDTNCLWDGNSQKCSENFVIN